MPKCYFLIGPPGCGKTTWREKNIKTLHKAVAISTDDLIEELMIREGLSYNDAFNQSDIYQLTKTCCSAVTRAVLEERDIIIDQTNGTVTKRAVFRKYIPSTYETIGVVFEFEDADIYRRVRNRQKETGKEVPYFAVKSLIACHQTPLDGEFDRIEIVPREV